MTMAAARVRTGVVRMGKVLALAAVCFSMSGQVLAQKKYPIDKTVYYLHGRIYTSDPQHPWAAAMAIRDEKILCLGTIAHILLDCGG